MHTLEFNEENINLIKDNLYVDPSSLPMVHEPIEWSDTKFGGYILNEEYHEDIINGGYGMHDHSIENKNNIYKAINKMSKIKFQFNHSLFDYLMGEGQFLLVSHLSNMNITHSEIIQIKTQLLVADVFRNQIIYIPLQID